MPPFDTAGKKIHGNSLKTASFVVQRCAICDSEFELVAGDIILGDKWYHRSCWESEKSAK